MILPPGLINEIYEKFPAASVGYNVFLELDITLQWSTSLGEDGWWVIRDSEGNLLFGNLCKEDAKELIRFVEETLVLWF